MAVHVAPVDVVLGLGRDGDEDDRHEQQKSELSIQHGTDLGEGTMAVSHVSCGPQFSATFGAKADSLASVFRLR